MVRLAQSSLTACAKAGVSTGELITKQAVGQLITDLEAQGYVERQPDPTDQRAKMVVLTGEGRKGMLDGLGIFKQFEAELAAEVGQDVVDRLIDGLERLLPAIEARV